jgi:hypothetical protein
VYVVGFNSVVGAYLYTKLKRYRDTYVTVDADSRTGKSATGAADPVAPSAVAADGLTGGVGPYPGTGDRAVFADRQPTGSRDAKVFAAGPTAGTAAEPLASSRAAARFETGTTRSPEPEDQEFATDDHTTVGTTTGEDDLTVDRSASKARHTGEGS